MHVSTSSYFSILNSEFTYNTANQTSTIEVIGSSTTVNNTISGSIFSYNSAIQNTISLLYSDTIISLTTFNMNSAT